MLTPFCKALKAIISAVPPQQPEELEIMMINLMIYSLVKTRMSLYALISVIYPPGEVFVL